MTKTRPTFPCSGKPAVPSVTKWAGPLSMRNRRKVFPATKSEQRIVTSCKSSRTWPGRKSSTSCWCSCLTASGALQMKRPLWWNGSSSRGSRYGAPRKASSVLTATPTSSPITSVSGRLTERAKRLPSAPRPLWDSSLRRAGSRAGLPLWL